MGSNMSTNANPVNLYEYIRRAFASTKRRADSDDVGIGSDNGPDIAAVNGTKGDSRHCSTDGPSSSKQPRLYLNANSAFYMASSSNENAERLSDNRANLKKSLESPYNADNIQSSDYQRYAKVNSIARSTSSAPLKYNGQPQHRPSKPGEFLFGAPPRLQALSPPPPLLPARGSRFSRVPPGLLPIGNGIGGVSTSGSSSTTSSSYGLNGGLPGKSAIGAKSVASRLLSSTPKWSSANGGEFSQNKRSAAARTGQPFADPNASSAVSHDLSAIHNNIPVSNYQSYADILRGLSSGNAAHGGFVSARQAAPAPKSSVLIDLCNDDDINTALASALEAHTLNGSCLADAKVEPELPKLPPINSMKQVLASQPELQPNFVEAVTLRYKDQRKSRAERLQKAEENAKKHTEATSKWEDRFVKNLTNDWCVASGPHFGPDDVIVIDDSVIAEPEFNEFPTFTNEQSDIIQDALNRDRSRTDALITKFNITIRRQNIQTLIGLAWLDDEVINFYMEMLVERSRERADLPNVYAFNTFFLTRYNSTGYPGIRRWTRRVDIFTYDIITVPVHIGNVHWCMAVIDFRHRTIRYYDSMGSPNDSVLRTLADYLVAEMKDKKNQALDISGWKLESMKDIPQQNNQSDCGVFSCSFAETISRNAPIRFSQKNMPYIRMKMVLEICQGKLLL